MAAAVTLASAVVAFPIAYYAARYASTGRTKAAFYIAIMLPLWSSYLVKVYAWKLILAKEGILSWVFAQLHLQWLLDAHAVAAGDRRPLAVQRVVSSARSSSSSISGCPT